MAKELRQTFNSLSSIWKFVEKRNKVLDPRNPLPTVVGGGRSSRPEVAFIFINPTARNASTRSGWSGPRYPFIGTKQVWKIFHRARLIEDAVAEAIQAREYWDEQFAEQVYEHLEQSGFYLTNLVKWTGPDGSLPEQRLVQAYLPLLLAELEIVRPKRIVTFGLLPTKAIIGKHLRMEEIYKQTVARRAPVYLQSEGSKWQVMPCYFPVGRGNPRRAVDMLSLLAQDLVRDTNRTRKASGRGGSKPLAHLPI
jgi:uracil-DNA glycosylase